MTYTPRHAYQAPKDLLYYETLASVREYGTQADGGLHPEEVLSFFRTRGQSQESRA